MQATNHSSSAAAFDRACRVLVGGVNSPVRAFGSVGGSPYFVARAAGSRVWDVDGNEYIDYVQSYGASILGHADPDVNAAIIDQLQRGTAWSEPGEAEYHLAQLLTSRVPSLERIRFANSGTRRSTLFASWSR